MSTNKLSEEESALLQAASYGDAKAVSSLIEKGVDVNARNSNGRTPLWVAASQGHSDVIKLLVSKGADPDNQDKKGSSAIIAAYLNGKIQVCQLLASLVKKIPTDDEMKQKSNKQRAEGKLLKRREQCMKAIQAERENQHNSTSKQDLVTGLINLIKNSPQTALTTPHSTSTRLGGRSLSTLITSLQSSPKETTSVASTLEQKSSRLVGLIDVLCDNNCHSSKPLENQDIKFIVAPKLLKLWSKSPKTFRGMMVRPVYKKLAQTVLRILQANFLDDIVIGGNPGMGKSMFAIYFLYLFITSSDDDETWTGLTHLAYDNGLDYLFIFERGKRQFKCEHRADVMNYVDSLGLATSLIHMADGFSFQSEIHSVDGRLVYISSPHTLEKADLDKDNPPRKVYMPIWSYDELKLCNDVMKIVDEPLLQQLYDHFGGSARHVLFCGSRENAIDQLEILDDKIGAYEAEKLVNYILKNESSPDVSYSLIHFIVNDNLTNKCFIFASEYIQKKVLDKLFKTQKHRLISFLRSTSGLSLYSQLRGVVFERVAHDYFDTAKSDECFTVDSLEKDESIKIRMPTETHKFLKKKVKSFINSHKCQDATKYYFKPADEKFGTVDAFILPNIFLQMTVSTSHGLRITDDFVNIVEIIQEKYPHVESLMFVWVIPADIHDQFEAKANITVPKPKILDDAKNGANSAKANDEESLAKANDEESLAKAKYERNKQVARMIKQYKMSIEIDDKLWDRLISQRDHEY